MIDNSLSWNKRANVIYLEQPAGVGYSYSADQSGYTTDDNQTAIDNYAFLNNFFKEFPEFSKNDFWLTGESYAGVYIPTLANQILDGSNENLKNTFQGFMLGNPVIHCPVWVQESSTVIVNNWYWHGLISYSMRAAWYQNNCPSNHSATCDLLYSEMYTAIGPYDGDNLYMNFCTGNGTLDFTETQENCYSLDDLLEWYLNVIINIFFQLLFCFFF